MGVFNNARDLSVAIDSVIQQTYPNWELCISDDGSTDGSWDIILNYQKKFPSQIKSFRQEKNLGILKNVNFLLEQSTGDFLSILDADDFIYPTKLAKQIFAFEQNPDLAVCWTGVSYCDEKGNLLAPGKYYPTDELEIREFIKVKNAVPCRNVASMMYPRRLYEKLGGYRSLFDGIGSWDIDLVLRLIEQGNIFVVSKNLYFWRKHPYSFSRKENLNPLRNQSHQIAHLLRRQRAERQGGDDLTPGAKNSGEVEKLISQIKNDYQADPSRILREMANSKDLPREVRMNYAKRSIKVDPFQWKNYKYFFKAMKRA